MKENSKVFDIELDEEERRIEEEMERGKWVSVENAKEMIELIIQAAKDKIATIKENRESSVSKKC